RDFDQAVSSVQGTRLCVKNISFDLRDSGSNIRQYTGAILSINGKPDRISHFIAVTCPLYFHLSFRVQQQVFDIRTVRGVNRYSPSHGNITDDIFASDWITTLSPIDQEIIVSLDLNSRVSPKHFTNHRGET